LPIPVALSPAASSSVIPLISRKDIDLPLSASSQAGLLP